MKKIALSVLAVAVLVSCATQSAGPDLLVNVLSGSERKAAFVPPAHNRFPILHGNDSKTTRNVRVERRHFPGSLPGGIAGVAGRGRKISGKVPQH